MRKVKVKMNFDEMLALRDMLLRFEEMNPLVLASVSSSSRSAIKKNMIKLYQSTLSVILYNLTSRSHMVWPKAKTVSFTLPEAYALTTVLHADYSTDFELAFFSSLLLQIEPQLP